MGVIDCFSTAGRQAKTVYARTQEDADKFNAVGNGPDGLRVIVKQ